MLVAKQALSDDMIDRTECCDRYCSARKVRFYYLTKMLSESFSLFSNQVRPDHLIYLVTVQKNSMIEKLENQVIKLEHALLICKIRT